MSIKGFADLFLDTLVFNGHGTGMDILWAGVPVLTISSNTFQSRTGRDYATVLGVPDVRKSKQLRRRSTFSFWFSSVAYC